MIFKVAHQNFQKVRIKSFGADPIHPKWYMPEIGGPILSQENSFGTNKQKITLILDFMENVVYFLGKINQDIL